jgi:uncharacterized protein YegP (UPF0339 family)
MTTATEGPVKVELYKDEADEWRWRTRCPENGNILAGSSEGYVHKQFCKHIIVRHFGSLVEIHEVAA